MTDIPSEERRTELFLMLHAKNQFRLSAFVHTLVADWQDAEEIVQETFLVLWRKFDEFDPATDFFAWGAKVAQYQVLNYRRRSKRQALLLDESVMEAIGLTAQQTFEQFDERREALSRCVTELPEPDRRLLQLRYSDSGDIHCVAESLGRTVRHVHRVLAKIRGRLARCIEVKLTQRS